VAIGGFESCWFIYFLQKTHKKFGNCDDKIDSLKMRCYFMWWCDAGGAAMIK